MPAPCGMSWPMFGMILMVTTMFLFSLTTIAVGGENYRIAENSYNELSPEIINSDPIALHEDIIQVDAEIAAKTAKIAQVEALGQTETTVSNLTDQVNALQKQLAAHGVAEISDPVEVDINPVKGVEKIQGEDFFETEVADLKEELTKLEADKEALIQDKIDSVKKQVESEKTKAVLENDKTVAKITSDLGRAGAVLTGGAAAVYGGYKTFRHFYPAANEEGGDVPGDDEDRRERRLAETTDGMHYEYTPITVCLICLVLFAFLALRLASDLRKPEPHNYPIDSELGYCPGLAGDIV